MLKENLHVDADLSTRIGLASVAKKVIMSPVNMRIEREVFV